jgi:indole-3-glycerol phosphate synthase
LLEIHNDEELNHICNEVDLVGVNNRNLKTFEVSIETSLQLINKMPTEKPAVAESGISNIETILTLRQAGFKGFLIGENFMKSSNPALAFENFVTDLKTKL